MSGFGGVDHVAKFESCDINCAGPFEVNEQGQAIKGDFEVVSVCTPEYKKLEPVLVIPKDRGGQKQVAKKAVDLSQKTVLNDGTIS